MYSTSFGKRTSATKGEEPDCPIQVVLRIVLCMYGSTRPRQRPFFLYLDLKLLPRGFVFLPVYFGVDAAPFPTHRAQFENVSQTEHSHVGARTIIGRKGYPAMYLSFQAFLRKQKLSASKANAHNTTAIPESETVNPIAIHQSALDRALDCCFWIHLCAP